MRRSNRLILLIGIVLAIVAFIGIVLIFQGSSTAQTAAPKQVPTVYAKVDIPFGATVTQDKVEIRQVDPTQKSADAYADSGLVVGKVATTNIVAGQQLVTANFAQGAGAAAIAQNIPAGLTGVAIQVDQVSGVGTLINVGDHVDVVAGFDKHNFLAAVPSNAPAAAQASAAPVTVADQATSVKVLVENLQVVGTLLPPAPTQTQNQAGASAAPNTTLTGASEIVIVAATPQQAEVIKFAQMEGSISLTLRSPKDFVDANGNPVVPATTKTTGVVLKTLLDDYGVLVPQLQTVTVRVNR